MQLTNEEFFAQVEQMLAEGNEVQLRVKGGSMRPLLRSDRDRVVLAPYRTGEPLRCGQVVLFRYRGQYILHRIVRIEDDRLILEGDGNYHRQEHCRVADVAAVMRRIVRSDGREIACDSGYWRHLSRLWRMLPPLARRYILALLYRAGYR